MENAGSKSCLMTNIRTVSCINKRIKRRNAVTKGNWAWRLTCSSWCMDVTLYLTRHLKNKQCQGLQNQVLLSSLTWPDLEIILSLLGTWVSNRNPTAKRGRKYWIKKNPLAQMEVLAPRLSMLDESARTPINPNGNFWRTCVQSQHLHQWDPANHGRQDSRIWMGFCKSWQTRQ